MNPARRTTLPGRIRPRRAVGVAMGLGGLVLLTAACAPGAASPRSAAAAASASGSASPGLDTAESVITVPSLLPAAPATGSSLRTVPPPGGVSSSGGASPATGPATPAAGSPSTTGLSSALVSTSTGPGPAPAQLTPPTGTPTTGPLASPVGAAPTAPPGPIDPQDPVAGVAGPEGGARCAAAPQYADEPGSGLDPAAAAAWDATRRAAVAAGVELCLADGKRSWDQQLAIAQDYVDRYGREMARQYVLPPEASEHVRGLAVDVQPTAGHVWLEAQNGSGGFCRTYDNEPWHFEWSASYVTEGCPARLARPAG